MFKGTVMSKYWSMSVIFLMLPASLVGCSGPGDNSGSFYTPPPPLSVQHDLNQCPALTGTYIQEYEQDGKTQTTSMDLKLEMRDNKWIFSAHGDETIVDGQSYNEKDSPLDKQAGCSEGVLRIQTSVADKPLGQTVYTLDGNSLKIESKSLDEKVLTFTVPVSIWTRKE